MDYINIQFTQDEFMEFLLQKFAGHMIGNFSVQQAVDELLSYIDDRSDITEEQARNTMTQCLHIFQTKTGI